MISILVDLDNTLYPKKYLDILAKEIGFDSFSSCQQEVKDYIFTQLYKKLCIGEGIILDAIPNSTIIYLVSKKYTVTSKIAFFDLVYRLKQVTGRNIVPIPDISRRKTFEILRPHITIHDYDEDIDEYCKSDLIFRVNNYIIEDTSYGKFISELETSRNFSFYQVDQCGSLITFMNKFINILEEKYKQHVEVCDNV